MFIVVPILFAQSDAPAASPTDPNALLQLAAPYYDYASPDMKPWHIRYHYQYFDENGLPSAEGEFDYWWSTTKVSRASWTHGDQTHSDQTHGNQSHIEWHTADGKELRSVTGNDVAGMEGRLSAALTPPFLKMKDSLSGDRQLKYFTIKGSSQHLDCIGSVRAANADVKIDSLGSVWAAYCFEEHEPVLLASHENGTITTLYGQVRKFQNHNFPGQIEILYVGKKRVQATLEDLSEVHADDVAFTPSPDAKEYVLKIGVAVVSNSKLPVLIRSVQPEYPIIARTAHITGIVVIDATIGKDGRVKDANVVSSPLASFSAAALDAVRQWRYEPMMMGGQPTEVHTQININFAPR